MKLPAIETPDAADVTTAAREWAFRLATLPFTATVDDVAMLVQAAMDEAVRKAQEAAHMRTLAKPAKGTAQKLRRARKRLADAILAANAVLVRERDGNTCRWCGDPHGVEVHHIVYRSRGGKHDTSNLICLCAECHREVHAGRIFVSGNADINHDLVMKLG